MDSNTPIIVIELVLTFGGVLLFGWWQLRSIKRDQQAAAARKLLEAGAESATSAASTTLSTGPAPSAPATYVHRRESPPPGMTAPSSSLPLALPAAATPSSVTAAAANAASATTTVRVDSVSVIYPAAEQPVVALDQVSLDIGQGEFVSLIGPSGCGKTTLLRVIADLEPVSAGSVRVNGMSPHEARLARAYGYVFQAPALFPWRSVLDNVRLPLEIQGVPADKSRAIAMEQLARVGLAGFERKYPWQLSGGMQQRVSIARALGFEPQLLMMDEPFGALDEITRDRLGEQLLKLWRGESGPRDQSARRTVVFVTHSIPEAVFLSTRIVVMSPRPGRIVEVIESDLPAERTLEMRETPEFAAVAHRVRLALHGGHGH
jgi:NitT/TauT family transport system ATP-binding protein